MMKIKLLTCVCTIVCLSQFALAQTDQFHQAPTLQVGLDGLSLGKGSLDAQLITEIIAEKQSEIKVKLVQSTFLGKLDKTGGTVYNYAHNVIKTVVENPDPESRTRKLLESTVNLVFVYAFLDQFYRNADDESKLAMQKLYANLGCQSAPCEDWCCATQIRFDKGFKTSTILSESLFEPNGRLLKQKENDRPDERSKEESDQTLEFVALMFDIASEVIREDTRLKELGLMRTSYSSIYEYKNEYKRLSYLKQSQKKGSEAYEKYQLRQKLADEVKVRMRGVLANYTEVIGAIGYQVENLRSLGYSSGEVNQIQLMSASQGYDSEHFQQYIDNTLLSLKNSAKGLSTKLNEQILQAKDEGSLKLLKTQYESDMRQIAQMVDYLKRVKVFLHRTECGDINADIMVSDILFHLQHRLQPQIQGLTRVDPARFFPVLDTMKTLQEELLHLLVRNKKYKFIKSLNPNKDVFIRLVGELYQFDKASTFSDYRNLLPLLDDLFDTPRIKEALATINTFVKDYIVIKTDESGKEVINFKVETFLAHLEMMPSDKIRRVKFHFTVGANTGYFNKDLTLKSGEVLRSFSHVSEKIGLKYKIWSGGDWMPRSPGDSYTVRSWWRPWKDLRFTKVKPPREPLISDFHALLYGSGILYNVVNSGTNEEFNFPMLGTGLGFTFYNALDLNATISVPIFSDKPFSSSFNYPMYGIGFDIQFVEYLEGVEKKRQANQTQKRLAQADVELRAVTP